MLLDAFGEMQFGIMVRNFLQLLCRQAPIGYVVGC
jgi:hypothetical protein